MITQKINYIMGDPSDDEENYLREQYKLEEKKKKENKKLNKLKADMKGIATNIKKKTQKKTTDSAMDGEEEKLDASKMSGIPGESMADSDEKDKKKKYKFGDFSRGLEKKVKGEI